MAKELKPRSGEPQNNPAPEPADTNGQGGQIAEPDYNPSGADAGNSAGGDTQADAGQEDQGSQNTGDAESVTEEANDGGAKWNEDGSAWVADKLEGGLKSAAAAGLAGAVGGGEAQASEPDSSGADGADGADGGSDGSDDGDGEASEGPQEDASVGSQNGVGEPESIEVDESDEEDDTPTMLERAKKFAKDSLTQNPISKGFNKATQSGMDLLTGVGLSRKKAALVLASTSILLVATVGMAGAAIVASNDAMDTRVVGIDDCRDEKASAEKAKEDGEAGDSFSSAEQMENVKKIYSVLKEYGLKDVEIAGAVANMQQESGINPKRIEAMNNATDSDYQKANKEGSTVENLFGSWASFVSLYRGGLNERGYLKDGKHYMGVGLIQWTGESNYSLWKWANTNKLDMWSLDTQLTALLTPDSGPYADRLKTFVTKDNSTPEKAALNFLNFVEYGDGGFVPNDGSHAKAENRVRFAATWYVKIKEMQVDKSYAKSILDKVSSSIKAAADNKTRSTKRAADDCGGESESYGGTGWQKKEGVYEANNGGWQAWKYDELPEELKKYAIDPRSLGMKYNSMEGWTTGAAHYISAGYADQCTALSAALMGLLWEKDGQPLGMKHGMTDNGDQLVGQMSGHMGVKVRTTPVSGDVTSTGTYNHTQVVSHVFENGDILVIEQNIPGLSGQANAGRFQWSYQYVTKAKYEADKYTFTSPEGAGYKINPKAKSVG